MKHPVAVIRTALMLAPLAALHATEPAKSGGWQEHRICQGDGKGGWITRPALRQVLKHPEAALMMPFGLVRMDNGEIALLCSRENQPPPKRPSSWKKTAVPVIAFSKDGGATWSDFTSIPGTEGRPHFLTGVGGGRLSFVTESFEKGVKPQRIFSSDYGRTWTERIEHPLTKEGKGFGIEGNAWVDRGEKGMAKAILEIGWHAPDKGQNDYFGVFRRSVDGGKTWIDEVTPPQWKFTAEHNGKKWLRGVSEGAIVRAANGDLVAALRTDIPPKYLDGPHDDSLEGTAISISKDDGKTWSELQVLFEAGRMHANLQRLPNGDLVCTLIVRDDIQNGKLASHRRGCDAIISKDHGKTWNLDRRYELDAFDFMREDGYWVDGQAGHVGAVALPDGHVISAYGHYQLGAAVLVKWKTDARPVQTVPKVGILTGPKPTEVERYAADELAGYLRKLFRIEASPAVEPSASSGVHLLVGTPASNPAVAKALGGNAWPKVSDQGIVLKKATLDGKPALIVGGGSDAATLWAVYELVERWGVRYLLHGDVLPRTPGPFRLPDEDVVLEPNLRIRQWRTVNDAACGPISWGLAEHRRVIDQPAKLRFNRIFVCIYRYQPFLDLQIQGIRRKSATLWFDYRYPITDDMPGRGIFGKQTEFWNPDLPARGDGYEKLAAAGERLIKGILAHAKSRGMQCVMNANLMVFPCEFAPLLPDAVKVHQLSADLNVVPGPKTGVEDPSVTELAAAVLRATVNTYKDVDYVLLGMPELSQWVADYERAWQVLDRKYRLSEKVKFEDVLASAGRRTGYPGGAARAVQEVKGDIVALYSYDRLLTDLRALQGTSRPDVKFIINGAAEEWFSILPRILPPGSETLNFVDYTPARILKRRDVLGRIPAHELPTAVIS